MANEVNVYINKSALLFNQESQVTKSWTFFISFWEIIEKMWDQKCNFYHFFTQHLFIGEISPYISDLVK